MQDIILGAGDTGKVKVLCRRACRLVGRQTQYPLPHSTGVWWGGVRGGLHGMLRLLPENGPPNSVKEGESVTKKS